MTGEEVKAIGSGAMILKPNGKFDLDHRAYFLRGMAEPSAIVAASEDGYASVFGSDFTLLHRHRLAPKLRAVAPHPTEQLLAWANGESGLLVVQPLAGDRVAEIPPPQWRKEASQGRKQSFDDCFFDEDGKFLWVVGPISHDEIELQLIDASDWSILQKVGVEDQFGSSSCSLHSTSRSGLIALWIAAGQDGQQVYWLKRQGRTISCEPEDKLANTTPPVFSPDGSALLALNQNNALCKYEFPAMKQFCTPLESEDENNPFAESMCFVDHRHALASTGEGRIFLLDTDQMRIVEEVELQGHEPRPIGEYYPSLSKERGLGTDITWFTRIGKAVVFIYRRDRGTGLEGWKDSIVWYSVKS
jgi:hypothetical protein